MQTFVLLNGTVFACNHTCAYLDCRHDSPASDDITDNKSVIDM